MTLQVESVCSEQLCEFALRYRGPFWRLVAHRSILKAMACPELFHGDGVVILSADFVEFINKFESLVRKP
jgi:hypothetical protein